MLCFDQKKIYQMWKIIIPMDFAEHLSQLDFSENSKDYLWSISKKWTSWKLLLY